MEPFSNKPQIKLPRTEWQGLIGDSRYASSASLKSAAFFSRLTVGVAGHVRRASPYYECKRHNRAGAAPQRVVGKLQCGLKEAYAVRTCFFWKWWP